MTTYYVGPMGNDNNSGRTWATRLATLNGAEDKPVVAGDTVYVAPGVYRETLTVDVSGTAGAYISYIGDVSGEHTGGIGGPVRVTGSDNDQTATRANCITQIAGRDYRLFRGFTFDMTTGFLINGAQSPEHWIIEDCSFSDTNSFSIEMAGDDQVDIRIRRCAFLGACTQTTSRLRFNSGGGIQDSDHVVENCLFIGGGHGVNIDDVGGIDIRNCLFYNIDNGVRITDALPVGYTAVNIENCICVSNNLAVRAINLGEIVENYNTFYRNNTDRTNVNVGGNSVAYPPLFEVPLLNAGYGQLSGFRLPWWFGSLSRWSQIRQITGSNEPDEDLFGIRRPYTHGGPVAAECSWGPVQWFDSRRSDIRAYDGNLSMRQAEKSAAWMFVPGVTATSHTITVRNWRTAGYGGHRNPEMIIKQPGQADRRTVAGGAAGAWVQLSDTFTPAADPGWLLVEMRNNCDFTTTTTVSTTSTSTLSTTSTTTATVSTLTTTTTTLACDVWWDSLQVA